jgi:nucleotide-binding universal stress UspA family protein
MAELVRKYLVIADDTPECRIAAHVAARRAKHSEKGRVAILSVIEPSHFGHWVGVEQDIREDQRTHYEQLARELADIVATEIDHPAEIVFCEGEVRPQVRALIEADPEIKVLVLGADTGKKGPGPLVAALCRSGFAFGDRHIPVLIVPGDLTPEAVRDLA